MVEDAYGNTIKTILRCLRDEQHSVIFYLADVRWVEIVAYFVDVSIMYFPCGILYNNKIIFTIIYRKKFQDYLKRPDLKQEFVSQWQSDFNSIADDLREDEGTKAELHQRVTVSKQQNFKYILKYYLIVYKLGVTRMVLLFTFFFLFTTPLKLFRFLWYINLVLFL